MNYYIITYQVIIDNHQPIVGTTGNVVFAAKHSRDYKPLQVAQYVREEYELLYPNANEVRVRFQYVELVDERRYDELSETFTLMQWMCRAV